MPWENPPARGSRRGLQPEARGKPGGSGRGRRKTYFQKCSAYSFERRKGEVEGKGSSPLPFFTVPVGDPGTYRDIWIHQLKARPSPSAAGRSESRQW